MLLRRRPGPRAGAPFILGTLVLGTLAGCGSGDEDSVRAAAPSFKPPPAPTPTPPEPKADLYGGLIKPPERSARPRRGDSEREPTRTPRPRRPRATPSPATEPKVKRLTVAVPAQGTPSCGPSELVARTGETWIFTVKARGQATVTVAGQSFDTAPIAATESGRASAEVKVDQPGTYPVTTDPALESPCSIVIR